jgi:hypothetical protein
VDDIINLKELNLSKRLKRKLHELLGLDDLSRELRFKRAREILNDSDYKQEICNENIGVSHRDIDKVLKEILKDKKGSLAEQLAIEYDIELPVEEDEPEVKIQRTKKKLFTMLLLDTDEVNELLKASDTPLQRPSKVIDFEVYSTYSMAEALELLGLPKEKEEKNGLPRGRQNKGKKSKA